jgi:hypothetical protein
MYWDLFSAIDCCASLHFSGGSDEYLSSNRTSNLAGQLISERRNLSTSFRRKVGRFRIRIYSMYVLDQDPET